MKIIGREHAPEVLKALMFAFSTIAFLTSVSGIFKFNIEQAIPAIAILGALYLALALWGQKKDHTRHQFEKGSNEELNFFKHWYSQPGILKIFCTDVLWLEGRDDIIALLHNKSKGDHLYLYVRLHKHQIISDLFDAGAHLYKVKDKIKSNHRFSILDDDGDKSVIIRNKKGEKPATIEFEEYRNHPALYNLADDMLDDCGEEILTKNAISVQAAIPL